jgi:Raf kinase inhibitor-like YbhB/YbcL family protein
VMVDIPAAVTRLEEGGFSQGVTPRGKKNPKGPAGSRQGLNDYTSWFASDRDMAGDYYGYDGPCPPWNDEIPHRYVFTVYALDVARLPLEGRFGGGEARAAIRGHVMAQAALTGRYTLNPAVKL